MILTSLKDARLGATIRYVPKTLPLGWELAIALDSSGATIRLYDALGELVHRSNKVVLANLATAIEDMLTYANVKHSYTLACQLEF